MTLGGGCSFTQIRRRCGKRHFPLLAQAHRGRVALRIRIGRRWRKSGECVAGGGFSSGAVRVRCGDGADFGARHAAHCLSRSFISATRGLALRPGELIRSIVYVNALDGYFSYARKIGTRNAQAISKVCIAATGTLRKGRVEDIRIGLGSVAPTPLRLAGTEGWLRGAD